MYTEFMNVKYMYYVHVHNMYIRTLSLYNLNCVKGVMIVKQSECEKKWQRKMFNLMVSYIHNITK